MTEVFLTNCKLCEGRKTFKTQKSLETHYQKRHPGQDVPACALYRTDGCQVHAPMPRRISSRKENYKQWLSLVVECINSAHYPRAPGKWYHMDFPDVELKFLCHLLYEMKISGPHSVKETKHIKFPMWTEKTLRFSFKTTCLKDFVSALSEQNTVELCISKTFKGMKEIKDNISPQLQGRAALEAAKSNNPLSTLQIPTKRSQIRVDDGEGRATHECELIWWPLYDNINRGKLTIRLYIGKVDI